MRGKKTNLQVIIIRDHDDDLFFLSKNKPYPEARVDFGKIALLTASVLSLDESSVSLTPYDFDVSGKPIPIVVFSSLKDLPKGAFGRAAIKSVYDVFENKVVEAGRQPGNVSFSVFVEEFLLPREKSVVESLALLEKHVFGKKSSKHVNHGL